MRGFKTCFFQALVFCLPLESGVIRLCASLTLALLLGYCACGFHKDRMLHVPEDFAFPAMSWHFPGRNKPASSFGGQALERRDFQTLNLRAFKVYICNPAASKAYSSRADRHEPPLRGGQASHRIIEWPYFETTCGQAARTLDALPFRTSKTKLQQPCQILMNTRRCPTRRRTARDETKS